LVRLAVIVDQVSCVCKDPTFESDCLIVKIQNWRVLSVRIETILFELNVI
jgi:hypothetical protein